MITLSMDLTEEQARAMIESIDSVEEGERWEPELSFQCEDAQQIRRYLLAQVEARQ